MTIKYNRSDGLFIFIIFLLLGIGACPLDHIQKFLKSKFANISIIVHLFKNYTKKQRDGIYIELYVFFWTIANTLLFYAISHNSGWVKSICCIIVVLRFFDFLRAFLGLNLDLTTYSQRSVARSYFLLLLNFFELAAIFSSIHYFFCDSFDIDHKLAEWQTVYYFSLRNMLTIGGGDLSTHLVYNNTQSFIFGVIRIAQPLFALLFVTLGISQTLKWSSQKRRLQER